MLFYIQLSETVRDYMGKRYDFPGTEFTTTEIMDSLTGVSWPAGLAPEDVRAWLDHCDRVKFAGYTPEQSEAESSLRRAFSFVELTRHVPLEKPPEGGEVQEDTPTDEPDAEATAEHEAAAALGATAMGGFSFEEAARLARGESLSEEE